MRLTYDGAHRRNSIILSKIKSNSENMLSFGNRDYGGGAERFYEDFNGLLPVFMFY